MANALTTLFTDIAIAIRSKNGEGEEVKYAPSEFPSKILDIPTSGGGSTVEGLSVKTGNIYTTSSIVTVEHGLGHIPDIIFFYSRNAPVTSKVFMTVGFSTAFYNSCPGSFSLLYYKGTSGSMMATYNNEGFENVTNYIASRYGAVQKVTTTSFTVGGSSQGVDTTSQTTTDTSGNNVSCGWYEWMAISGITG